MESQKSNTLLSIGIGILGGVVLALALYYTFSDKTPKNKAIDMPPGWQQAYAQQQQDIAKWKIKAESLAEDVDELQVEKGVLEIELNRKSAKLDEYAKLIKQSSTKIIKTENPTLTESAGQKLDRCDSLAQWWQDFRYTYVNRDVIIDSMNNFYFQIIEAKDSQIIDQERWGARVLSDLTICQYKKAEKDDQLKKEKKKTGIFAGIAAAVGLVLGVSIF